MPEKIGKKVLSWASILNENTKEQAIESASMPFIHPHIALMPDAHYGLGSTVGSVIPTQGAIMPAAIGVDIGCGMAAELTELTAEDIEGKDLAKLRAMLEDVIPLSPGNYNKEVTGEAALAAEDLERLAKTYDIDVDKISENWRNQLGTLGGGNHFIEIVLDELDRVWVFLHSGSRGVGNRIARKFIKIAEDKCKERFIELPNKDLAYLVQSDFEFWQYIRHMWWAQEFAAENRSIMLIRVLAALEDWYGEEVLIGRMGINAHHNYTVQERHFGKEMWVSRKGAISAYDGELGLIPGSMGDRSYVVSGKGNRAALCSAPHGAGRQHSRRQARELFTQDDLRDRMKGIEYRDDEAFVDEIPDAYKPIDTVMEDSEDLVEIVHELRQIVNVKGE